jgi:putative membrane protein
MFREGTLARGIVAGLVGGLLGAGVMSAGHALLAPKEPAGGEDATLKVARRASELVRHRPLAESEKPVAGHLVHYGFGATMGALYGTAAAVAPVVTVGAGAGFGVAVWLGAHAIVVPALGLAPSPLREPRGKEALELVLHVAYGVTLGLVHRAAVRRVRAR